MGWRRFIGKLFGIKSKHSPAGEAMDELKLALRKAEHARENIIKLARGKKVDITNPEENPEQIIKEVLGLISKAEEDLKAA